MSMSKRPNRLEKGREQRSKKKLRLGGYLIITDAKETERNYFDGFKASIPSEFKDDLQIKVFPNKELRTIIEFAENERNRDELFREVWIIFDRDEVPNFDELILEAKRSKMKVGWSNPCFEIWLSAYFGVMKNVGTSKKCCSEFERLLVNYTKKKEYKKSDIDLYDVLVRYGDEGKAREVAGTKLQATCCDYKKPSEMESCTTVYQLIDEIREKTRE